jgi:UDPglucose 6-dehydrogenase
MGAEPTLNIAVVGLWHLGCVTAACCSRHFQVVGLDLDASVVEPLRRGKPPLYEPGLEERLREGLERGRLCFTTDPREACASADILWLTADTPVDERDAPDVNSVLETLRRCLPHLGPGALVLISSQLPAGTCRLLETEFPQVDFACSPENLRLGKALEAFEKPERVVVGLRDDKNKARLARLFQPFTSNILWMRTESAEMVKHGLNAFLALSITFINELAALCEKNGADAREVAAGLKSDPRIGPKAYLGPGGPFAGGTLARDVVTLTRLSETLGESIHVIPAIKRSNDHHRGWALRRLRERLGPLPEKNVAILGLTYTPHTDTLRRSAAVELSRDLLEAGCRVRAYDPAVKILPTGLERVRLESDLRPALEGADAAVVCTEWPQIREASWPELAGLMKRPLLVDPNGFLEKELKSQPGVEHLRVGRAS